VDASGYAVGAVLLQRKKDGKKHPIGYYSATLNEAQRNYDIYDLELLAIVMALKNWRPLLVGSPHKIIIYSDHLNLQYWRLPQRISRRVAREVLELSEYDFEIRHLPGRLNGQADVLSRRPGYDQGEDDNKDIVVLPDHVFAKAGRIERAPPMRRILGQEEMESTNPIYEQDEELLKSWIDAHQLKKIDGVWYKDGRRVVTGKLESKRIFLQAHHDAPVYGHPGINKMYQLTSRRYWWPNMRQDVMDYVRGCAECQRHKINMRPTKASLSPIFPIHEAMPFETVALDFITKLPVSQGFDTILTVTDHDCTKAALFIPCKESMTAEETAGLIIQHVFSRFGLPLKFISDRDPKFALRFIRGLCKGTGTTQNISTAYHPRMDGQSERTNQWLEQYLRFWVNERQDNWHMYLPLAEFAHNNWPSETTGESPFFMLYGFNPRADWIDKPSPILQVALRIDQFKRARQRAQELMIKAQQSWVKNRDMPKYREGDLVWLEGRHLRTNQPTAKLAPRRHGPFPIVQVMSPVNYRLKLPTQWSIHDVFHIDLLTPYRETDLHRSNYSRPAPDLVDNKEEYKVEKILDVRQFGRGHKRQYLIKWKGYPDSDNEWVDKRNVHAPEAIREFEHRNPASASHINQGYTSKYCIPSSIPHTPHIHTLISFMTDVNNYYLGSPERIFATELEHGLITFPEARELCAKKYIRPHVTDENLLVAPLTDQELASVLLVFPDLDTSPMPPRPLSPMVRRVSDPDGMGATPTHQADTEEVDDDIWGPKDGHPGEIPLPVPFKEPKRIASSDQKSLLTVEGRTVHKSRRQEKRKDGSTGSTALVSTPATRGPWSRTTSYMSEEEIYPAEHMFIRTLTDSNNPNETPYTATTTGFPLYKGSYRTSRSKIPPGFKQNLGDHFIAFPITNPEGEVRQAEYVQVILHPNPIVVGLRDDSDKVYTKPLYATPVFHYDGKAVYHAEQLERLKIGAEDREWTDRMIARLGDPSLAAEIHRFRMMAQELERLEEAIVEGEDRWGELAAMHCKTIRRLEMVDTLRRIQDQDDSLVDDALRMGEAQRGRCP